MPTDIALANAYSTVAVCARGCAGIENDPSNGIIGRSFYCPFDPTDIDLLIVSKNPGISDPRENALYAPLSGAERVQAHEDFVYSRFIGENRIITSNYHANLLKWVAAILDVPAEHDEVFKRAAMTALVKCHSAGAKTDSIPRLTKETCSDLFLFSEIDIIRPKFLLALGGETYSYLVSSNVAGRHKLTVGKLYHPSWSNMPGGPDRYMRESIPQLRHLYLEAIAT